MFAKKIYCRILLPLIFNRDFTYYCQLNRAIAVGTIVEVEFGKKKLIGVVSGIINEDELLADLEASNLKINQIKPILQIAQDILFTCEHLEFIDKIANYNLAKRGLVFKAFINGYQFLKPPKTSKSKKKSANITENTSENTSENKNESHGESPLASVNSNKEPNAHNIDIGKFNLKTLSVAQKQIVSDIAESITAKTNRPFLLQGVTGSGKTEVYFAIIADFLANSPKAQILILLPEISLTSQLTSRFSDQFGFELPIWHSKIGKKDKQQLICNLNSGAVKVLAGARSALLLPFANLQLIIIDEEHSTSFKQEDGFYFNARDMAVLYANRQNIAIILGSATPSIETLQNVYSGKYQLLTLPHQYNLNNNKIQIIDLKNQKISKNKAISPSLLQQMQKVILANNQILLFLNRRGYAPLVLCKECGEKQKCCNCDFHLVFHARKQILSCHHCGYWQKFSKNCNHCHVEEGLIHIGLGVEKVYEEVANYFPEAKIALITSDNITNNNEIIRLIEQIQNKEIDIIIGTQMITKGYDFKGLELVAVLDADAFFYSSELRSTERAYQMLTQVIGRVGRHNIEGKIIIQTYNPKNPLLQQIVNKKQQEFYNQELLVRSKLNLPPFSKMAKIVVSAKDPLIAKNFADFVAKAFPFDKRIRVFGPAPAIMQKLKGHHRFIVNITVDKKINLQKLINQILLNLIIPRSAKLHIDIDPIE